MAGLPARHKPINRWSELYNPIAIPECPTMPALSEQQPMIYILLIIRSAADRIKVFVSQCNKFGQFFDFENLVQEMETFNHMEIQKFEKIKNYIK